MSAYVVSDNHVRALLTFAKAGGTKSLRHIYLNEEKTLELTTSEDIQTACQILKDQCIKSVMHRYPQDTLATLPGPNDMTQDIEYRFVNGYSALEILKACNCYEYQACEDPEYDNTPAKRIITAIQHNAMSRIEGYDDARGWSID